MSQSGYVHLEECDITAETDKAFLIAYDGEELWIPKSQIANPSDYREGMSGATISITAWIAREKGIEVES